MKKELKRNKRIVVILLTVFISLGLLASKALAAGNEELNGSKGKVQGQGAKSFMASSKAINSTDDGAVGNAGHARENGLANNGDDNGGVSKQTIAQIRRINFMLKLRGGSGNLSGRTAGLVGALKELVAGIENTEYAQSLSGRNLLGRARGYIERFENASNNTEEAEGTYQPEDEANQIMDLIKQNG